jgi:phage terminase small subunit
MALSKKQQAFIDEYFICGMNATEAARRVGYSDHYLNTNASKLLRNTTISEEIDRRLKEKQLSSDEVLARLSDMARADMRDFIKPIDVGNDRIVVMVDLGKALAEGKTHLIKKVKYNAQGGLEIELHDSQAALEKMGRHYGLFKDTTTNLNVDVSQLTNDQLERIAGGEDPLNVLANTGEG